MFDVSYHGVCIPASHFWFGFLRPGLSNRTGEQKRQHKSVSHVPETNSWVATVGWYGNDALNDNSLSVVCPWYRWPLWSSGQSSWLQIQRSGFDSWRYQIFWEVVGLERGPLSLVSTIEELLERKSSGSCLEIRDYGRRGSTALTTRHPSIRISWYYLLRQAAVSRSYSSLAD
jgi:hypothetical protein